MGVVCGAGREGAARRAGLVCCQRGEEECEPSAEPLVPASRQLKTISLRLNPIKTGSGHGERTIWLPRPRASSPRPPPAVPHPCSMMTRHKLIRMSLKGEKTARAGWMWLHSAVRGCPPAGLAAAKQQQGIWVSRRLLHPQLDVLNKAVRLPRHLLQQWSEQRVSCSTWKPNRCTCNPAPAFTAAWSWQ